jgi:hypothetical protein
MAEETILQNEIFTNFALPFLLIFFIVFGILEKTKLFGEGKKQLNALIAFVIGLIFVAAVFPKLVVGNLILFLTIAIVVMFVALLLWGFVTGQTPDFASMHTGLKWVIGIVIVVAVGIALLWAMGIEGGASDLLFEQSWSGEFWTNAAFVVVVIVALVLAMKTGSKSE